jgi:Ni/Fe-hydrogenase b-type cytochrome subunit
MKARAPVALGQRGGDHDAVRQRLSHRFAAAAIGGEPSSHFLFGWIRFAHFACGQIMALGIIYRFYWSFIGNHFSREIIRPPLLSKAFWRGVWFETVCYAKAEHSPRTYIGHNPLAVVSMHVMFLWVAVFMICTGLALYGEGEGRAGSTPCSPARLSACSATTARACTPGTTWACGRW